MESIQNTVIGALESVKDSIEKRDKDVKARPQVFAKEQDNDEKKDVVNEDDIVEIPMDKLKQVGLELLDIGLYYGEKGVDKVKSLPLYQKLDKVVEFDDKFAMVSEHGQNLYTYLNGKLHPLVENVFFLYDKAKNTITSYIKVVTDKHD